MDLAQIGLTGQNWSNQDGQTGLAKVGPYVAGQMLLMNLSQASLSL